MSEKRNVVHWSILALRLPQTSPVWISFDTFDGRGVDFANSAAVFHILSAEKRAVCCTPVSFSFIERIREGICPAVCNLFLFTHYTIAFCNLPNG